MTRSDIQKRHAILIAAILLTAVLVAATAPASAGVANWVNKTVYDSSSGTWVKTLTAELNDTVRFNCTITNMMPYNLTEVRFWDVLDCSLDFAGNSTLKNASGVVTDIDIHGNLKPKVLHPQNLSWNFSVPEGEYFDELCPEPQVRKAVCWEDTDGDKNVSACDQIRLTGPYPGTRWYHVDRVPYTLTLSNETFGPTNFDSVLDWDDPGMNLSDPINSTWLELCCSKDRYTLLEWIDRSGFGLGSGDTVTMRNERTGEVVGYYIENITKDLVVSREFGIDNLLDETFILEPDQTITIEYDATIVDCGVDNNTFHAKGWYCPDECEWVYSNEAKVTITVFCPELEVNKTVYDPDSGEWVKELTAKMNDTLQFKNTITNTGNVNFTEVRFWDIMDCSLNYTLFSLKINGEDQPLPDCWVNRFKPKVLHPDYSAWDLSNPTLEYFTELCPQNDVPRQIVDWDDTNDDLNVSACDQVELTGLYGSRFWYHVDRVPYTLNLSNANGTTYFDSVLNWNEPGMDLSDPNGTEWLGVCCCKDTYTLLNWADTMCGNGKLSNGDTVTMQNELTGEEVGYTVTEIVKDLVVSREYDIDDYLPDLTPLEPGQTITIEYNATVVRCGVDNNTFFAKGNWSSGEGGAWEYSNEDKVTITVPCPSGEATDPTGLSKEVYTFGEPVYAVGSGFEAKKNVSIYIVPFQELNDGVAINTLGIIVGPINVTTDDNGDIGPELIWPNPVPGRYLIIFDDPDGDYNQDRDPLDGFSVTGGALPALTPFGIVALVGLLSIIATSTLVKRRKR